MATLTVVRGDITTLDVDAIVNAANRAMRGGGGVDGAIHRAGGPAVLADCVERFPNGLATGNAGWTTGGDLPARWVIHTVGPNFRAGETDRDLLVSCYRRSLEVADELGVQSIAFPLISAGVYGWPKDDAIAAAVDTLASTPTQAREIQLVAFDQATFEAIDHELAKETPLRILQGVRHLHRQGHQQVRVRPGVSPSGMHWRVTVGVAGQLLGDPIRYTTGATTEFAGTHVTVTTTAEEVAAAIVEALPLARDPREDAEYAAWFDELMRLVEEKGHLPISYADYFDDTDGWEIGWGSGRRHPHPPPENT